MSPAARSTSSGALDGEGEADSLGVDVGGADVVAGALGLVVGGGGMDATAAGPGPHALKRRDAASASQLGRPLMLGTGIPVRFGRDTVSPLVSTARHAASGFGVRRMV
jgi:hypothetical protein